MEGYLQKQHQGPTKRFVQTLTLSSDEEARREYIKWHSPEYNWKEVRDGIRKVGILEMEIYILGNTLVMIVDAPADFRWDEAMAARHAAPTGRVGSLCQPVPGLQRPGHERREVADDGADVLPVLTPYPL